MTYKPILSFIKRKKTNKIGIWVTMPNGNAHNIWDLKKSELTPDVMNVIAYAFGKGMEAHKDIMAEESWIVPNIEPVIQE